MASNDSLILLVEDDPDHEALAIRALRKANVANQIKVARDGAEAVEYMEQVASGTQRKPQLVLLDLKLPKVEGLEVLRNIRASDKTALLPVVVLTSSEAEQDILASYDLNANCYVTKPVDLEQFMRVVRSIEDFWLTIGLSRPYAPLLALLAMNNGAAAILPKAVAASAAPMGDPVGTGPYRFVEHKPDQYIRLARFDGYASPPGAPDGYAGERRAIVGEIRFVPVPNPSTRVDGMLSGQYQFADSLPSEMLPRLKGQAGVAPGDSLWAIARTRLGAAAPAAQVQALTVALHHANRVEIGPDPDLLHPGQRLRLPADPAATSREDRLP